jgi:hypothetical protein
MGENTPNQPREERRHWVVVGTGIVAVVLVVAGAAWLLRSEPKTSSPPPPYVRYLQFSDLKISAAENFVGATVTYLDGNITNTGDQSVSHATVNVVFKNSLGQIVQTENLPIRILQTSGPYPDAVDLTIAPLTPHSTRPFRLILEHVSADWNQQYPELKIVQVTSR